MMILAGLQNDIKNQKLHLQCSALLPKIKGNIEAISHFHQNCTCILDKYCKIPIYKTRQFQKTL